MLLLLAAGLTAYLGFTCFASAMSRHAATVHRTRLRWIGGAMLVIAYLFCIFRDGLSFGTVLWMLMITASAIAVAFTLAWRRS